MYTIAYSNTDFYEVITIERKFNRLKKQHVSAVLAMLYTLQDLVSMLLYYELKIIVISNEKLC